MSEEKLSEADKETLEALVGSKYETWKEFEEAYCRRGYSWHPKKIKIAVVESRKATEQRVKKLVDKRISLTGSLIEKLEMEKENVHETEFGEWELEIETANKVIDELKLIRKQAVKEDE